MSCEFRFHGESYGWEAQFRERGELFASRGGLGRHTLPTSLPPPSAKFVFDLFRESLLLDRVGDVEVGENLAVSVGVGLTVSRKQRRLNAANAGKI
jgi:hypothetical protein